MRNLTTTSLDRLRKLLISIWILTTPFLSSVNRVVVIGSEIGSTKPSVVATTGVAVGAGGTMAIKGPGWLARILSFLTENVGIAGRRLSGLVGKAATELGSSTTAVSAIDRVGIAEARPTNWDSLFGILQGTKAGKGLSSEELLAKMRFDPPFRAQMIEELKGTHPERVKSLQELVTASDSAATLQSLDLAKYVDSAIKSEPVYLYDEFGRQISGSANRHTEVLYRDLATRVFGDVLKEVPPSRYKSEEELRAVLRKAFESSSRKAEYKFDVMNGELELKIKTKHGEVTGKVNAYSVGWKLVVAASAGAVAYDKWLSRTHKKPQAEPEKGGDKQDAEKDGEKDGEKDKEDVQRDNGAATDGLSWVSEPLVKLLSVLASR